MENELKHQIRALEVALLEACLSSDFSESTLPWQWLDKLEERRSIRLAADLSASLREKAKRKLQDESLSLSVQLKLSSGNGLVALDTRIYGGFSIVLDIEFNPEFDKSSPYYCNSNHFIWAYVHPLIGMTHVGVWEIADCEVVSDRRYLDDVFSDFLSWKITNLTETKTKLKLEREKKKSNCILREIEDLPHELIIPADAIATLEFVARFSVIDRHGEEANIAFNANRNKCFIRTSDKFLLIGFVKSYRKVDWEIVEYDTRNRRGCEVISCYVVQVRPYADELETSNGLLAFLAANFSLRRPYWRLGSRMEDVSGSLDIDKATPDIKLLVSTLQRYGFLIRLTATYSPGQKQYQIEFSDSALGEVRIEKDFSNFYLINNYGPDSTEIEEWSVSEDQVPVKVLEWLISKNGGIPSRILDARERVVCLFD